MRRVREQFEQAQKYLAGGVAASTRVNRALGHPLYFARAEGCRVWDLDGREYLDLCASHGAALLGHGDLRVRAAVDEVLARGAACSYENELQTELARELCQVVPCLERVRLTGSGSEATLHCLRLARAYTGRNKILKFEGHFHGYHDQVMIAIGTPADQLGPPAAPNPYRASAGMSAGIEASVVVVPFNRLDLFEEALSCHGRELAAVICEPVYYNAGCILPEPGFLEAVCQSIHRQGGLLIFDEVLSAFRMCAGGAQAYLQVTPDLCTLGKAVGGGYPLSVFGGRAEIMNRLMPEGDCQHSGTYCGHPVVVAAGLAAVRAYRQEGFYEHVAAVAARLIDGLNERFARYGVAGRACGLGARLGIYFGLPALPRSYREAVAHDRRTMLRFVAAAIAEGVYFHDYGGAACHHGFAAAMTLADADEVLVRLDRAIARLAAGHD